MLLAVLRDAVKVPDLEVVTIWNARLERFPVEGVAFQLAHSPEEEIELLAELAAWCDITLLIAPEFDGILTQRALLVEGVGGRLCGPSPLAITNCSDKLQLARTLQAAEIATIETREFSPDQTLATDLTYPAVVKPRDGAGSQETYFVRTADEFQQLLPTWKKSSLLRQAVWQTYHPGRPVSVAVLVTPEQYRYEALLPCEQLLSSNGRFEYLGGIVPTNGLNFAAIRNAAIAACREVPGLRGYVGVDLIVPDDTPETPLVVEINPRITTSYLGYCRLCEQNLIARWLDPDAHLGELTWRPEQIEYAPGGELKITRRS
jgi:predicted ATP-grasp superfamily ATP-dependent carboligase